MGPLPILALLAFAVALLWIHRRRAADRRAGYREELTALLAEHRPRLRLTETGAGHWRVERDGVDLAAIETRALIRAAAGSSDRRRLFVAVADAAEQGPRPFDEPFDLKLHGPRMLPRLADPGLPVLALEPPAVRFTAADAAGMATIYVVSGEPRPAYLSEEHLAGAGIDARDLHGLALAVLRQRFDEASVRDALGADREVAIETADGCGASRLLLLPEALAGGELLYAAAPSPRLLLLATDRGRLETALAVRQLPVEPLPPVIFRVTAGGPTRES